MLSARALMLLAGCLGAAALAGCQAADHAGHASTPSAPASSVSPSPTPAATLSVVPVDATTGVTSTTPVVVTASGGRLTTVTVSDAGGDQLTGELDAAASQWSSNGVLVPQSTYQVSATAVNPAGVASTLTSTFTTAAPSKVLGAKIAPLQGETVGVGMPVIVYFTQPVTDRAAVERRLSLDESIPVVGAWHWYSSTEVHYRPESYWPAGDRVTLHADIKGVDAGNGTWGVENHTVDFKIGDSHITTVDAKTDKMTVAVNGTVVKTAAVSLGRDKYPTTSGIHVVLEKESSVVMDSATVGIPKGNPDYYYETVLWDVRISWSGEFVHSAPWSVSEQGRENVSHGCVNASPADAEWFYDMSRRGDIVQIENTPRPLQSGNGWTDWNMSWSDWLAGSALGTSSLGQPLTAAESAVPIPVPVTPAWVPPVPPSTPSPSASGSGSGSASAKPSTTPSVTPSTSSKPTTPAAKPTVGATTSPPGLG